MPQILERWHLMASRAPKSSQEFPLATAANCWQLHSYFHPVTPSGNSFPLSLSKLFRFSPLHVMGFCTSLASIRVFAICWKISICLSLKFHSRYQQDVVIHLAAKVLQGKTMV